MGNLPMKPMKLINSKSMIVQHFKNIKFGQNTRKVSKNKRLKNE